MVFQAINEPAPGGARRGLGAIHRRHGQNKTPGRRALGADFYQQAARDIRSDELARHATPAQSCSQKRVFGPEIGKPPRPRRQYAQVPSLGERGAIREHQLDVLRKLRRWDGSAIPGQWMLRCRDMDDSN